MDYGALSQVLGVRPGVDPLARYRRGTPRPAVQNRGASLPTFARRSANIAAAPRPQTGGPLYDPAQLPGGRVPRALPQAAALRGVLGLPGA